MTGLTKLELEVVQDLGGAWNKLCDVVGDGATREDDLAEMAVHMHALQRAVMSQAAARTHPEHLRLLGETL